MRCAEKCVDATALELLSCLYEATVPESGMNFEDRLPRESVEGTLEEDTACRTQKTVLRRRGRAEVNVSFIISILKRERQEIGLSRSFREKCQLVLPANIFLFPSYQFE